MSGFAWPVFIGWAVLLMPLCCVVAVFGIQVLVQAVSALRVRQVSGPTAGSRPRLAVLMPAHNEAAVIEDALKSILSQLKPGDTLLVVADNCDDATAALAMACGAVVTERTNPTERGKGFALAHGIDVLRKAPPDLVVIVDADCELASGALDALAQCVQESHRPAQALYLMLSAEGASLAQRLAEFAWRVRNWVRPEGWHRLGMPCQLMGTGMAFQWTMLETATLANASIVEDMKLGLELAVRGTPPVFCAQAKVTSRFPETSGAATAQRTRWEHGHLEMILREVPSLLLSSLRRRDWRLFGLACDLAVPPLALLAGSLSLAWVAAAVAAVLGASTGPLLAVSSAALVFTLAVLLAWLRRGRDLIGFTELLSIPLYVLAKVPIYLRFVIRRQKEWVRTDRKG